MIVTLLTLLISVQHRDLSPANWPAETRERYEKMGHTFGVKQPLVESGVGMIGGTTGPLAVHAGLETLKAGGSAADAAIVTAMGQIVLSGGSWNSFGGIFNMVYYEAKTGRVYAIAAGYDSFENEKSPTSIPAVGHSGRTALVPGFFAGVGEAHKRFGKLPFSDLFAPALYLAENGITLDAVLGTTIQGKKDILTRLPDGKALFTKPDGTLYASGDTFKQTELAKTLRKIAAEGVDYLYKGPWAKRFVAAVNVEGGKASLHDLSTYRATVTEPAKGAFRNYTLCAVPDPEFGGVNALEAMALADKAGLGAGDPPSKSPERLAQLIRIARFAHIVTFLRPKTADIKPIAARLKPANIEADLKLMAEPNWEDKTPEAFYKDAPHHSDGIIVVDAEGNVAALCHTSNDIMWGSTGIFVDGISIPDSASFQQQMLAHVKPGDRLPNATNPIIVLKDGKPVVATVCIGSGLHESMVQNLLNVLGYGMDFRASIDSPMFWGPMWSGNADEWKQQTLPEHAFSREVTDGVIKLGQPLHFMPVSEEVNVQGFCIGMKIGAKKQGATNSRLNGIVEGY